MPRARKGQKRPSEPRSGSPGVVLLGPERAPEGTALGVSPHKRRPRLPTVPNVRNPTPRGLPNDRKEGAFFMPKTREEAWSDFWAVMAQNLVNIARRRAEAQVEPVTEYGRKAA